MFSCTKAYLESAEGHDYKVPQTLFVVDPHNDKLPNAAHKSCFHVKKTDELSKVDMIYQKCKQLHPQFYFNNLGILYLKLHKFKMA